MTSQGRENSPFLKGEFLTKNKFTANSVKKIYENKETENQLAVPQEQQASNEPRFLEESEKFTADSVNKMWSLNDARISINPIISSPAQKEETPQTHVPSYAVDLVNDKPQQTQLTQQEETFQLISDIEKQSAEIIAKRNLEKIKKQNESFYLQNNINESFINNPRQMQEYFFSKGMSEIETEKLVDEISKRQEAQANAEKEVNLANNKNKIASAAEHLKTNRETKEREEYEKAAAYWAEHDKAITDLTNKAKSDPNYDEMVAEGKTNVYYDVYTGKPVGKDKYFTQEQKDIIAYYMGIGDIDSEYEYRQSIDYEVNNKHVQAIREEAKQNFEGKNVWHKALGAMQYIGGVGGEALMGGLNLLGNAADGLDDKYYRPIDPNDQSYVGMHKNQGIAEGLKGDGNAVTDFLWDTGLSLGRSIAMSPLGAVGAPVALGLTSTHATTSDAVQRGATNGQAQKLGLLSGAIEAGTEFMPNKAFLDIVTGNTGEKLLKNAVTNILSDSLGEAVSEYGSTFADNAIMGKKSNYELLAKSLMESGMSEQEAKKAANINTYVINPAVAFASGALSAGVSSGTGAAVNKTLGGLGRLAEKTANSLDTKANDKSSALLNTDENMVQSGDNTINEDTQSGDNTLMNGKALQYQNKAVNDFLGSVVNMNALPQVVQKSLKAEVFTLTEKIKQGKDVTLDKERLFNTLFDGGLGFRVDHNNIEAVKQATDNAFKKLEGEANIINNYVSETSTQTKEIERVDFSANELKELYEIERKAQRQADKIISKTILTKNDKAIVDSLVSGRTSPEYLQNVENIENIMKVYEAKKQVALAQKPIKKYNAARKNKITAEVEQMLENSDSFKDKKSGLSYGFNTLERNFADIIDDKLTLDKFIDYFSTTRKKHVAEKIKYSNKMLKEIKSLKLSQDESEYLHMVETKKSMQLYEMKTGYLEAENQKQLVELNKKIQEADSKKNIDYKKIEKAKAVFRKNYDQLFKDVNDTYVKNGYAPAEFFENYYAPVAKEVAPQTIGEKILKGMGYKNTNEDALPTEINGLTHTFKPGVQYNRHKLHRAIFDTDYDAVEGFQKYLDLTTNIIFLTEDLQKVRTLENAIRYKYSDEGVKKRVREIRESEIYSEEEKAALINDIYKENPKQKLSNFAVALREYGDVLAGKKNIGDRQIEHNLGRKFYKKVKFLESRLAANMVGGNIATWITNLIPITQLLAEVKPKYIADGIKQTIQNYKQNDGFVDKSTFLTNRQGVEKITLKTADKAVESVCSPMTYVDLFTSNVVTRSRYAQEVAKGFTPQQAIKIADRYAADLMADRSYGAMPMAFYKQNPLTKVFTMFQLEVNNNLQYLFKDLPRNKREEGLKYLAAALFKVFVSAYLFNDGYEKLTGRRAAFDPISILNDLIGDLSGYQLNNIFDMPSEGIIENVQKENLFTAGTNLARNIAQEIPFIGSFLEGGRLPITSSIASAEQFKSLGNAVFAENPNTEKIFSEVVKTVTPTLSSFALPVGGNQIKKTLQGAAALAQGGDYKINADGERQLKFNVDQSFLNGLRTLTFGKYANEGSQDYIDRGFKPALSVKETKAYEELGKMGVSYEEFGKMLKAIDTNDNGNYTNEEIRNYLELKKTDVSNEELKKILKDIDTNGNGNYTNEELRKYLLAANLY